MSLKSYSSFSVKAFMIKVKQEKLFKHLDISLKVLKWGIFETKRCTQSYRIIDT